MKIKHYFVLALLLLSIHSVNCFAQSQGPNYPVTVIDNPLLGRAVWKNPMNAVDSNKVYATDSLGGLAIRTDYLEATGFNFSLPANATITGITVQVLGHDTGRGILSIANYVSLIKNSIIEKDSLNGTGLADTDRWQTIGGCGNLWDTTWTYSDINSPNFGVAYFVRATFLILTGYARVSIDAVRVSVCYTLSTSTETFTQTSDASNIYPNPSNGFIKLQQQGKYLTQVFDLTGKTIYNSNLQGYQNLDLSFLPNGVYFMRITSDNDNFVRKLVIQK